jgi:flavin reductase (DIM6/NTAB) family NADH-FMN oxidoreductase RutF
LTEFRTQAFRRVLGHFPTGVAVVTAVDPDGAPVGMAVGSFSSVSLDPPLVAFMPDRKSTSWPRIRSAGAFCVNVLGAQQENVCRTFASSGGDKFANLGWRPAAGSGSPVLDGVLAWIDCRMGNVYPAGDHFIVLGEVLDLAVQVASPPLVFFQGGYGRFMSLSLSVFESDPAVQLASADAARHELEAVAGELEASCIASSVVGDDLIVLATAGPSEPYSLPVEVGQRFPYVAPLGTAIAAWAPDAVRQKWMRNLAGDAGNEDMLLQTLQAVREHGFSVGHGSTWHDDAVKLVSHNHIGRPAEERDRSGFIEMLHRLRSDYELPTLPSEEWLTINVPVLLSSGDVILMLTVTGPGQAEVVPVVVERLKRAAKATAATIERADAATA